VVINISEPRQLLYFAFLFLRENFLSWILNNSDRNCLLEHVKYLIWQIERKRPNFQWWLLLAVLPLIYLIHNGLYPCPLPSEHKRRKDVGYHSLSRVRYLQKINNQSFNCLNTTPPSSILHRSLRMWDKPWGKRCRREDTGPPASAAARTWLAAFWPSYARHNCHTSLGSALVDSYHPQQHFNICKCKQKILISIVG